MSRFLRQTAGLLVVALSTTLQYRSNFVISFCIGLADAAGVGLPVFFVYEHGAKLSSWSLPQSVLVVAFFLVMSGLLGAFVEPNLGAIVEGIRKGTLDFMLLKPVDAQLLASVQKVDPTRLWNVVVGVGIGLWAGGSVGWPGLPVLVVSLCLFGAGMAAMYSLYLSVCCLSFWFVRVDNLRYLLSSVSDAGRWPVVVYKGWVRGFLTVVVPVALVTSYPVLALMGNLSWELGVQAAGVGVGSLVVSRWLWRKALGFYSSGGG